MHAGGDLRTHSLQQRVAWSTGLAAVGGALLVALLGGGLAWTLALRQEDRRLHEGLGNLAFVLDHTDRSTQAARKVLKDEQDEVSATGMRLSLLRGGESLGGPATLDTVPGCRTVERAETVRQCAEQRGSDRLVAEASLAPLSSWLWHMLSAIGLAVVVVGLTAAWCSRYAARVAIAPLEALRRAIATIDPREPSAKAVAMASTCSEVEQLRSEFAELLARLAESLGHARRFAFHAAHEWRTPLTALRAEVELLQEDEGGAGPSVPLDSIARHVAELSDRLERVLVLATPASRLQGEPVSMEATAQEVVAALGTSEAARVSVEGEEGLVQGDPSLLRMALRNAVENALKFSQGQVLVHIGCETGEVLTVVEDRGAGVDAAEAVLVFQPFFRGQHAQAQGVPGSGLGLALIAHIARIHGGDARFEPATRGARMCLALPAWKPTAA